MDGIISALGALAASVAALPIVCPSALVLALDRLLNRPPPGKRYGVLFDVGIALHVMGALVSAGTALWLVAQMRDCGPTCANGLALLLVAVPAWLVAVVAQVCVIAGRRQPSP